MVMEELSLADALRRSWRLAQNRWCRTFGAVVAAGLPLAFASFLWAVSSGSALVSLALGTVAWALAVPFTAIFTLFLFEDYRSLETQPEDYDIFGRGRTTFRRRGARSAMPVPSVLFVDAIRGSRAACVSGWGGGACAALSPQSGVCAHG